jgi:superfamily I DNA/RNA helicase
MFQPREKQAEVLEYAGGRMGVSAVPGSGKTQTLSALAAKLVRESRLEFDQEVLIVTLVNSAVENFTEFFDRFRRLNVRSNPELDALVDQARQVIAGIEPQQLRDSVRLRAMVVNDFTRIEQAIGGLLVDRPRRNILRRAGAGSGGAA